MLVRKWLALSVNVAATVACLIASPAIAAADATKVSAGDTAWVLTSSALVLLMTAPGLALFYAGMVRRKNVLATLMHSFILAALISVQWALYGYSLAFSPWHALRGKPTARYGNRMRLLSASLIAMRGRRGSGRHAEFGYLRWPAMGGPLRRSRH